MAEYKNAKPAEDLPGLGQFYCVECAKFFESEHSLVTHRKGSTHKRQWVASLLYTQGRKLTVQRVKALKEEPYSQKEAEAAIGLRTDNGPRQAAKDNTRDTEIEMEDSRLLGDGIAT